NKHNRDAQSRFSVQVRQMFQIPVVHSRCENGELATYGLFYRAESGLFLVYDFEQDNYRPLM
ncbi:MAG: carbonic anhydrase, partial [Pirellulaceae bacterium]